MTLIAHSKCPKCKRDGIIPTSNSVIISEHKALGLMSVQCLNCGYQPTFEEDLKEEINQVLIKDLTEDQIESIKEVKKNEQL